MLFFLKRIVQVYFVHSGKPRNAIGNLPNTMNISDALYFNRALQAVSKHKVRKAFTRFYKVNTRFRKVLVETLKEIVEITECTSRK